MTLDVRGGLKNTAINHSDYVVFEELLSNAIDSYLIRLSQEKDSPPFLVKIKISKYISDLLSHDIDIEVSCCDNGAGFGDEQVKAFVTKDSTYKDDLQIQGIGKCKGAGRIQFFHHFSQLSLNSTFRHSGATYRRTLTIDAETREVDESSFSKVFIETTDLSTTIFLNRRRDFTTKGETHALSEIFSCQAVARHIYKSFLQRLIVFKGLVGDFSIIIEDTFGESTHTEEIKAFDLPTPTEVVDIPLNCLHGTPGAPYKKLKVTRYSFPASDALGFQHEIALCANSAIVYPLTKHYLKTLADRKKPIEGKFELILIESDSLESRVNQQRDGFDIPRECGTTRDISGDFSLEDVIDSLEDYVYGIITPRDFDRAQLVLATQEKFGITSAMLEEVNIKIHYSDTEENIAKRVLKKFQEDIINDTSSFITLKQQLLKLDPRTEGFRAKVNELSWKYTSTIKRMDMTNLSQLVVRRSAMIEVLRQAVGKLLECQKEEPGRRNEHERVIHNIFFPMGKDNEDTKDHDIWLLNEEYQYFEHIASDKPLSSLKWFDGDNLFSSDVDESLKKLFEANNTNHAAKRPDIAIFSQEGSVIIVEFKAPDIPIQEHINDLAQYARLLAAKSNGKIKKFYGYLIGNSLDHSRMPTGWTRFPNGQGYFQTGQIENPETGIRYGELYSELLFYHHFIDRAERRLEVYKKKLNVRL